MEALEPRPQLVGFTGLDRQEGAELGDDAVAILGADAWTDWLQHTVGYETEDLSTGAAIKRYLQSAQCPATGFYRAIPDLTLTQVKQGQEVMTAFEEVLDTPGAAEALQNPVFKPLLDKAAG